MERGGIKSGRDHGLPDSPIDFNRLHLAPYACCIPNKDVSLISASGDTIIGPIITPFRTVSTRFDAFQRYVNAVSGATAKKNEESKSGLERHMDLGKDWHWRDVSQCRLRCEALAAPHGLTGVVHGSVFQLDSLSPEDGAEFNQIQQVC